MQRKVWGQDNAPSADWKKRANMRNLVLLGCLIAGQAWGATAYLVSQTMGTSVTGQAINVCVYQYGGQQFERYFPLGSRCPWSLNVQ